MNDKNANIEYNTVGTEVYIICTLYCTNNSMYVPLYTLYVFLDFQSSSTCTSKAVIHNKRFF